MTGIIEFESAHGIISVEVDEHVALSAGGFPQETDWVRKGPDSSTRDSSESPVVARAAKSFEEAMGSLRAYAGSIEDLILGMASKPSEVTISIGLKMSGSAGFIIAKAGAETEMEVSLKWQTK